MNKKDEFSQLVPNRIFIVAFDIEGIQKYLKGKLFSTTKGVTTRLN